MGWSGAPIPPLKVAHRANAWSRRALTWRARIAVPFGGSQRHMTKFPIVRRLHRSNDVLHVDQEQDPTR
eukprot:4470332-Prymnesium_polylepis.1